MNMKLLFICSQNRWRSLTAEALVQGVDAIYASLRRLHDIATVGPRLLAAVDQLNQVIERQEQTIEQFKSDNRRRVRSLAARLEPPAQCVRRAEPRLLRPAN